MLVMCLYVLAGSVAEGISPSSAVLCCRQWCTGWWTERIPVLLLRQGSFGTSMAVFMIAVASGSRYPCPFTPNYEAAASPKNAHVCCVHECARRPLLVQLNHGLSLCFHQAESRLAVSFPALRAADEVCSCTPGKLGP